LERKRLIGKHVAELIDDKATIQMGIGTIPDAVLKCLGKSQRPGNPYRNAE
jgi:acyl-CoA hydrolase